MRLTLYGILHKIQAIGRQTARLGWWIWTRVERGFWGLVHVSASLIKKAGSFLLARDTKARVFMLVSTAIMMGLAIVTLAEARHAARRQEDMLTLIGFSADVVTTGVSADFVSPSFSCQLPVYVTFRNKGDRGTTIDYMEVKLSGHETQRYEDAFETGALIYPEAQRRSWVQFPTYLASGETRRFLIHYDLGRDFIYTVPGEARVACNYSEAVCRPMAGQETRTFSLIAEHTFGPLKYTDSLVDVCRSSQ